MPYIAIGESIRHFIDNDNYPSQKLDHIIILKAETLDDIVGKMVEKEQLYQRHRDEYKIYKKTEYDPDKYYTVDWHGVYKITNKISIDVNEEKQNHLSWKTYQESIEKFRQRWEAHQTNEQRRNAQATEEQEKKLLKTLMKKYPDVAQEKE